MAGRSGVDMRQTACVGRKTNVWQRRMWQRSRERQSNKEINDREVVRRRGMVMGRYQASLKTWCHQLEMTGDGRSYGTTAFNVSKQTEQLKSFFAYPSLFGSYCKRTTSYSAWLGFKIIRPLDRRDGLSWNYPINPQTRQFHHATTS